MKGGGAIAITGIGAVTPIGCSAIETAASLRAGICRFGEQEIYWPLALDPAADRPEPVVASVVADLRLSLTGRERLLELGLRALRDLFCDGALGGADPARIGLFLALPEIDAVTAGWGVAASASIGEALVDGLGLPPIPVHAARAEGNAGSLAILGDAAEAIDRGAVDQAIVVGVDSFIDPARLRHLDRDHRIKSPRAGAGFVPGEAGSALLLENAGAAVRRGVPAWATLSSIGIGVEPQPLGGERESSGRGLSQALRTTLGGVAPGGAEPGGAAPAPLRWVLCDLNGEAYRAIEWGVVLGRLARELGAIARLSHAADCLGEVGAAIGGVLIAQAAGGFARGYAQAPEALLWAGAEAGLRAAVRVAAPGAAARSRVAA